MTMGEDVADLPTRPKAQAVLRAAHDLFLQRGFAATGVDAIAAQAGVSKATLYSYFATKEALFTAMVATKRVEHGFLLQELLVPGTDARATLEAIAAGLLRLLLAPDTLNIYRLVIHEAGRTPELGRRFDEAGPGYFRARLKAYIERLAEAGRLKLDDPDLAVGHFIGLIRADVHLKALLGGGSPSAAEIERRAKAGVEVFLRAYSA